jgi:DNA-binding transcriptional LysR family regulator
MAKLSNRPGLEYLHAFLLFADRRAAAEVAKELRIDEAAVSRKLKALRTRYKLLEKRGKAQALTARGREALPAVRSLLRQYDHLVEWLNGRQARPQGITVAAGTLDAQLRLPRALARVAAELPGWQLQVQVRRGRERILGTANGIYDLAIVSHDRSQIQALVNAAFGEEVRLEVEELAAEWLCLIARRGSPAGDRLAAGLESQAVPAARLADYELIGLDGQSGIRRQLELGRAGQGQPLRFGVEAGGWAAARECARQGLGAAVVPLALLTHDDRRDLMIRPLADFTLKSSVIYCRAVASSERDMLVRAIRETAEAHQRELRQRWQGVFSL